MIIRVDIDNTICYTNGTDYANAQPNHVRIKRINQLYDAGHTIIYWTARGSKTGKNLIEFSKKQPRKWGAKFHNVEQTPYYDIFIDDRSFNSARWFDK